MNYRLLDYPMHCSGYCVIFLWSFELLIASDITNINTYSCWGHNVFTVVLVAIKFLIIIKADDMPHLDHATL